LHKKKKKKKNKKNKNTKKKKKKKPKILALVGAFTLPPFMIWCLTAQAPHTQRHAFALHSGPAQAESPCRDGHLA